MRSGSTKRTPSQTRALCRKYVCSHINVLYTRGTHGVILLIYQHTHTQATMCVLSSTWPARTGIVCKRFAVHKGAQARAAFFALRKIVGRRIDLDCSALLLLLLSPERVCMCRGGGWMRLRWFYVVVGNDGYGGGGFLLNRCARHTCKCSSLGRLHTYVHMRRTRRIVNALSGTTHTTIVLCTAAYLSNICVSTCLSDSCETLGFGQQKCTHTHTLPHTAGYLANYAGQTPRMANPYPPGLFYRSS